MQSSLKGLFLIGLSASMLGLSPIFGKYAFQAGISVETLLFLRFVIAAVLLFGYLLLRKIKLSVSRKQLFAITLLGFLYCFQTIFYFTSLRYILSSLAVVLLYLYPIFVLFLTVIFDKQKLAIHYLLPIFLSFLGIIILVGLPTGTINYFGVLLAVGSALTYALYVIVGNRLVSTLSPIVTSSWVTGCTSLFLFFSGMIKGSLSFQFNPTGWYSVLAIAFLCTIISFVAFYIGIKHIGPTKAALFSTVEPIITTVCAYLLLNETINLMQILGIACILSSVIMVILYDAKKKQSIA